MGFGGTRDMDWGRNGQGGADSFYSSLLSSLAGGGRDGLHSNIQSLGFPGSSADKESACHAGDSSLGQKDPLEEGMAPVFLPGESHGQRHLAGYGPWYSRVDTTEAAEHASLRTELAKLSQESPPGGPTSSLSVLGGRHSLF